MANFLASPQYQTTLAQLSEKLQSDLQLPAVIGISGAQGTGKSTLAAQLVQSLSSMGIAAAAVSLDDYYLSKAQRIQLAKQVHPLLAQRGVPGTHDIEQAMNHATAVLRGLTVALPQFDKALDQPLAALPEQRLDVLILEGWCLGMQAQTDGELAAEVNELEREHDADGNWRRYVNQQLAGNYATLWQLLHPLIWLQAPGWHCVCQWRAEQEQQLRQQRGMGMTSEELTQFMLSFQRLTQASWRQLPHLAQYTVQLNEKHQPRLL